MEHIELYNGDSSDSVREVEPPKKLPPPLIDLTLDDTVLNVNLASLNASTFNSDKILLVKNETADTSEADNPSHWTDDMIKFYNDDWGGEDQFHVANLQSTMDRNPSLWEVSSKDLLFRRNRRSRSYAKCFNCCQFGHSVYQCKESFQIPKCYMCGGAGHIESACPYAICLTCGNPTAIYVMSCVKCIPETKSICSRCFLRGHHFINCSDNWRRFHSTIGKTTVEIPPSSVHKTAKDLWCCNCARKGHNQISCGTRDRVFPDTLPYVVTYDTPFKQDLYNNVRQAEPVASTSTSQTRMWEHTQTLDIKRPGSKRAKNLSKFNKKRRRRKKKKMGDQPTMNFPNFPVAEPAQSTK